MYFERDGIRFHYRDTGNGVSFVYQHGLGGDLSQPLGFFESGIDGVRLLSMDCRAHGETTPVGPEDMIGIGAFADDVIGFMDARGVERAVIGGISMGAAIALNIALRYPARVQGLILQRPAWLDQRMPDHLRPLAQIGDLIREHGAVEGAMIFESSETYSNLLQEAPDVAASALAQFAHPRAEEAVVRLLRIPRDAPCRDRAWRSLRTPALVLANRFDSIHPLDYGETLAREIPGAVFREIVSKSISVEQHAADVRREVEEFVRRVVGLG
ncbi:MAG: alpha/beta hydrolase [Candidatus Hydrogenedentes bacterium]|nr:alpha/beta hydrolase [Candidatus Hydrogenedentota bacterium]